MEEIIEISKGQEVSPRDKGWKMTQTRPEEDKN